MDDFHTFTVIAIAWGATLTVIFGSVVYLLSKPRPDRSIETLLGGPRGQRKGKPDAISRPAPRTTDVAR